MNRIKRLLTNIHFWVWAATHGFDFDYFAVILYPGIKLFWSMGDHFYENPYIHIGFYKPRIDYRVSIITADKYAKSCGIPTDDMFTLDDIPF